MPCLSIYLCISILLSLCFVYLLSKIRQRHECECRELVVLDVLLTPTGRESDDSELVPHRGPYSSEHSNISEHRLLGCGGTWLFGFKIWRHKYKVVGSNNRSILELGT